MALLDNLVSYWTMDEASGTRVDSVVASGNDLTDNNTVLAAAGIINDGADLERGNNEYLSITNAAQDGLGFTGDFTMNIWVHLENEPSNGQDYHFISKAVNAGNQKSYRLYYQQQSDIKRIAVLLSSNGSANSTGNFTYTVGTDLKMLTAVYDASAGTMTWYADGNSTPIGTISSLATSIFESTAPFEVGNYSEDAGAGAFDGIIDELGLWDRTLSTTEIAELYNSGSGLAYPFDGGGAATFTPRIAWLS